MATRIGIVKASIKTANLMKSVLDHYFNNINKLNPIVDNYTNDDDQYITELETLKISLASCLNEAKMVISAYDRLTN